MEQSYTYADAFGELQSIVNDIETGEVSVDVLAEKIKRASELIGVCKAKLTASEEEVDRLLGQLTQSKEEEGVDDANEDDDNTSEEFIDEEG